MKDSTKRVGLLGGTFNPVHNGHLHLAKALKMAHHLDEIWFIPASINPHKLSTQPASFEHRARMLQMAIQGIPGFRICDIESKRPSPSYTVDTLRLLKKMHPDIEFYLLLGQDSAQNFMSWKDPAEIASLVNIVVGSRGGEQPQLPPLISRGYTPIQLLNVSSTEVREKLFKRENCASLLPPDVYRYILENNLFLN